jgi:uncharacterized protein YoxC
VLFADFTSSDAAYIALAIFLLVVGLTLGYVFIRLAAALARATDFIERTEEEVMPVIEKTGGTLDRVNHQLDKVDAATTSAVDAVVAFDRAVRALSNAVATPIEKLSGLVAGVKFGGSSLRKHRDFGEAVRAGKEAAARREADLAEEVERDG